MLCFFVENVSIDSSREILSGFWLKRKNQPQEPWLYAISIFPTLLLNELIYIKCLEQCLTRSKFTISVVMTLTVFMWMAFKTFNDWITVHGVEYHCLLLAIFGLKQLFFSYKQFEMNLHVFKMVPCILYYFCGFPKMKLLGQNVWTFWRSLDILQIAFQKARTSA